MTKYRATFNDGMETWTEDYEAKNPEELRQKGRGDFNAIMTGFEVLVPEPEPELVSDTPGPYVTGEVSAKKGKAWK